MKSKMLGALALFTLIGALFVMQSAASSPPTADAATGTIHALNVGTCLTTDLATFEDEMCKLSASEGMTGTGVAWEVREEVEEVSTLYATYAYDPKTASDEPRVIMQDADLIKISISDSGRDKRTGVLIRGASNDEVLDDDTDGELGDVIREDLEDDGLGFQIKPDPDPAVDTDGNEDIKFSSEIEVGNGIEVHAAGETDSEIDNSGNFTLNFLRMGDSDPDTAQDQDWQFDPGDFDVDNGAVVRFYGCVSSNNSCSGETITNLKDYLRVDEDTSNGRAFGNTAPWLGVNASVPADVDIVILGIYYRTSDTEDMVGGETYRTCSDDSSPSEDDDVWSCAGTATLSTNDGKDSVVYTEDEIDDNDALVVRAKSDGDQQSVNLYMRETGRFAGQYQGYVRLTDANGDGKDPDASPPITSRNDWGHVVGDGTGTTTDMMLTNEDVAVLGVESGPVTIEYKDTDGRTRTLRIEIDRQPPAITITSPVHGTSSDDHTPDYNGSIEDTDSGIVADSFRLVIDNEIDATDDGAKNADFALTGRAPAGSGVVATSEATNGIVSHAGEYGGYEGTSAPVLGAAWPEALYDLGRESCSEQDVCHIKADRHEDGSNTATFSDSTRLNLLDGDESAETRDREYQVDFQAFAMDRAGNIGFSDSDPSNPRFMNDLGEPAGDRNVPNVFGYYSAHIITLDEKDPEVKPDRSATGFYGTDSDGNMIVDRSGVMVVFDGPIDASSVTTDTFAVDLDEDTAATVTDVDVENNYVFLKLAGELDSDATPMVEIAVGGKVEDMAGNETFANEFDQFAVKDGITPRLTVTLSGGSGTGTGSESAEKLTKDRITVHVESDELLQGAPRIAVVCSILSWNIGEKAEIRENDALVTYDIDDFVANRSGAYSDRPTEDPSTTLPRTTNTDATGDSYKYTCGYGTKDDNFEDNYAIDDVSSLNRSGTTWEFTWQNPSGAAQKLQDGSLTAVAFARDRSRYYKADGSDLENWGSTSAEFTLDTALNSPAADGGGDLQPDDGDMVKESRPFVLIEFAESTTVTLESVELDDVEIKDDFERPQDNRFVYWPASIAQGDHEVEVEATDGAGNEVFFEYNFEVSDRGDFLINLLAGWNAISVPADPVDTAIGAVFTDPSVDTVIGWDPQGWRIAVRRDGVWESNQKYAALNEIQARYGYWVKSRNFVRQPVELRGPVSRTDGGNPGLTSIQTVPGWNFVGVIDQDGDQTEDDFSNSLQGSDGQLVTASEYLGQNYVRAYTWDATFSRFDVVRPIDAMKIGAGVWVYYEGGIAP